MVHSLNEQSVSSLRFRPNMQFWMLHDIVRGDYRIGRNLSLPTNKSVPIRIRITCNICRSLYKYYNDDLYDQSMMLFTYMVHDVMTFIESIFKIYGKYIYNHSYFNLHHHCHVKYGWKSKFSCKYLTDYPVHRSFTGIIFIFHIIKQTHIQ